MSRFASVSSLRLLALAPSVPTGRPTAAASTASLLPPLQLSRRLAVALVAGATLSAMSLTGLIAQTGPVLPGQDSMRTAQVDDDVLDDEDEFVGLSLALPEDPPDSIRPRAWEELPSSWEDWAIETGDRVADLYSGELTLDEQRYTLKRLNVKLGTLRSAIGNPAYSKIRGQLIDFEQALSLRVQLAEAALDAMQNPPIGAGNSVVSRTYNDLTNQVVAVRNDLNRVRHGEMWKQYLRLTELQNLAGRRDTSDEALDQLDAVLAKLEGDDADAEQEKFLERDSLVELADRLETTLDTIEEPPSDAEALGDRIRELLDAVDDYETTASRDAALTIKQAMSNYSLPNGSRFASILSQRYRGVNVRGTLAESIVQRLLAQSNFEREVINDCILGARVIGCQFTNSSLAVDLVPSSTSARFRLNLNGRIQTQTTGYKRPATVYSRGNHAFSANKTVDFDGYRFGASPAAVGVNVNNQTTGVTTSIRFPIFRRIARNIARRRVAESAPQVRAITRQKIVTGVGERFNTEVNGLLGQAEGRIQQRLYQPLSLLGLTPQSQSITTTDTSADLAWLVAEADELSAGTAPPLPLASGGVSAQLHESYLNAFADRLDLHGRTLTNEQLRSHIRSRSESALGRSLPQRASAAGGGDSEVADAKFVFDTVDPVRIRVEDNRIVLLLRTGLELEDKDDIPTQIVEIPLNVAQSGSQIVLTQGDVSVSPVEGGGGFRQIARSKVMIQKIEETGSGQRVFDGNFTLKTESKSLPLTLQTLDIAGGWITATMR